MRISETDIEKAFGPGEEKKAPGSAAESAVAGIGELDSKLADLVEKQRRPDESHAQAQVRVMDENPQVMAAYEKARAGVIRSHGISAGAE
jgi:hypothetical protein